MPQNLIKPGDFVIVQRQGYTKLQKLKQRCTITLGRDLIELDNVFDHKYYETFRMTLKPGSKRLYELEEVIELTTTNQLSIEQSGRDNRNIVDDGSSQGLSKEQIEELRDQALSSSDIVEKLIANSKTFNSKTEYSQEKYLKKKEKKYFEYIQIRKPTIRLLAQMFFRQDPSKTQGIRVDDLSQILTYSNVQSDGNFLLYDSGTSGLITAAIMNTIGANTTGQLIHAHPGNECQKNAFTAMQFPREQAERCIHVNLYSVLRCFYQEQDSYATENHGSVEKVEDNSICEEKTNENPNKTSENTKKISESAENLKETSDNQENVKKTNENLDKTNENSNKTSENPKKTSESAENLKETSENQENVMETNENPEKTSDNSQANSNPRKRKLSDADSCETKAKKPCWQIENERACKILQNKVDSIIVVAKEHPINIVKELVPFLKAGRTLVVFSLVKEPLQDLYFYLKSRTDFIAIKLSNNFMRNYQILSERTHPEVNMNFGGYILSGFKLNV